MIWGMVMGQLGFWVMYSFAHIVIYMIYNILELVLQNHYSNLYIHTDEMILIHRAFLKCFIIIYIYNLYNIYFF